MPCKNKACCINKARTVTVLNKTCLQVQRMSPFPLVCSVVVICCFGCDQQLTFRDIKGKSSKLKWVLGIMQPINEVKFYCHDTQSNSPNYQHGKCMETSLENLHVKLWA